MNLFRRFRDKLPHHRRVASVIDPSILPEGDRRDARRRMEDRWRIRLSRGWMATITILWIWTTFTLIDDQNTIDKNFYVLVQQRCDFAEVVAHTAHRLGVPQGSPDIVTLENEVRKCRILERSLKEERDE